MGESGRKKTTKRAKLQLEAEPAIERIVERKKATTFAYFEPEDVAQEIRIICLRALDDYRPDKGPLENYLQRCVTNRLKNLRRDKYFRPTLSEENGARDRINIINALPLSGGDISIEGKPLGSSSYGGDPAAHLLQEDMQEYLNSHLPPDIKHDLDRLTSGERLSPPRVEQLREEVQRVLREYSQ